MFFHQHITMKKIFIYISLLFFLASCKVFAPSQMLRTKVDYKYAEFSKEQTDQEYKIAPFDKISFKLATNNGENLVNPLATSGTAVSSSGGGLAFTVEYDGMVKFPVFGRIKVSGLTVKELEVMLEEKYAQYYNDPFVQIEVSNMRVILFSNGLSGDASVITLSNPNMTLFEALATAGGVSGGKAYNIKIIRGDLKNPQIFLVDLSTLDGVKKANLVLQANDIIVIKPRNNVSERIITFVTPYLTLASFLLLMYNTIK